MGVVAGSPECVSRALGPQRSHLPLSGAQSCSGPPLSHGLHTEHIPVEVCTPQMQEMRAAFPPRAVIEVF